MTLILLRCQASFRQIYGSDWQIPPIVGRPYIFSNFAQSPMVASRSPIQGLPPAACDGLQCPQTLAHGAFSARADAIGRWSDVTVTMERNFSFAPSRSAPTMRRPLPRCAKPRAHNAASW
ncbi:MAG: hypothetical protein R2932_27410 [Caldilineaceae bacterium]